MSEEEQYIDLWEGVSKSWKIVKVLWLNYDWNGDYYRVQNQKSDRKGRIDLASVWKMSQSKGRSGRSFKNKCFNLSERWGRLIKVGEVIKLCVYTNTHTHTYGEGIGGGRRDEIF